MEENKSYVKDPRTEINIQTGSFKWKIMILENFRKKNNHIWSSYEKDIPIINFSSESKSEIWNKHVFFTIFLAAQQCSQGNTYFSWRPTKTAKERLHFLGYSAKQPRKYIFFLAANKNSQENIFFWLFIVTAKEMLYSLAAEFRSPRKSEAAKVNPDWCSVYT